MQYKMAMITQKLLIWFTKPPGKEVFFYNYEHRGKISQPVGRKGARCCHAGLSDAGSCSDKARWHSLRKDAKSSPCELSKWYCCPFSSWHVFQILIVLTKAICECSGHTRFSDSLKTKTKTNINERMPGTMWRTHHFWSQSFRTRLILTTHNKHSDKAKLLRVLVEGLLVFLSPSPN